MKLPVREAEGRGNPGSVFNGGNAGIEPPAA